MATHENKKNIEEAASLPIEERVYIADSILRSLNAPDSELDRKWASVAQRRLQELRSGEVESIPGEDVFSRIWERLKHDETSTRRYRKI